MSKRWTKDKDGKIWLSEEFCYPETQVVLEPEGKKYTVCLMGARLTKRMWAGKTSRKALALPAAKLAGEKLAFNYRGLFRIGALVPFTTEKCPACGRYAALIFSVGFPVEGTKFTCAECNTTQISTSELDIIGLDLVAKIDKELQERARGKQE